MDTFDGSGRGNRLQKSRLEVSGFSQIRIRFCQGKFRHVKIYHKQQGKSSIKFGTCKVRGKGPNND
jgi:hypothetical protein